jgi:hypothetical protein
MRHDFDDRDLRRAWQNQRIEVSKMTSEMIREKGRTLHRKTRRQLLGTLAGPLIVAFFYFFGFRQFPDLKWVLQVLFAVALVWSVVGLYFLNRGKWSAAMPGDGGLSAGVEFCRREIERRRDYFRGVLLWSFGPVLLTIGTFILAVAMAAGKGIFPNGVPFLLMVVVWIVAYFVIRMREQRELQREIDDLDEIERENSRRDQVSLKP